MAVLDSKIVLTIFAALILVLFAFLSPLYPVFQESVTYLLGVKYFSLTDGVPAAPGHYFYTVALRGASEIAGDGFAGMLLLGRVFALIALWSVYRAARFLHSRTAGFLAAFVFIIHPFILVSAISGDPAFASVAVFSLGAYLGIRTIRDPDPIGLFRFSVLLGLAGGFSFDAFLALAPLWLVLAYRAGSKKEPLIASVIVVFAGITLWLLPALSAAGGFSELLRLFVNGSVWIEQRTSRTLLLLEYGKAFSFGCLLFSFVLFFLLKKAGHAYRGRLMRHSILLTLPALIISLFQVALGRNPSALIIVPVPLVIFCASVGALLFEPESTIYGRRRYMVLGLMMALPGLVFLLAGGESGPKNDSLFRAEQWTLGTLKSRVEYSTQFKEHAERFASAGWDSMLVVVAASGSLSSREIAHLLFPVEVYDMHPVPENERQIMTYFHKHRRFLLTDSDVELKKRTCLFIGNEGIFDDKLPQSQRLKLPDGRVMNIIKSGSARKLLFRSQNWIME